MQLIKSSFRLLLKTVSVLLLSLSLSVMASSEHNPTISIGYISGWDDNEVATHVVATVLREAGYPVEPRPLAPAIMWQALARGDLDVTLSAWLPISHTGYFEKHQDKVEILGTNYKEARVGLVVPDYLPITSIEQLNNQASALNHQITGIDAGGGLFHLTNSAIEQYHLDFKLMPSSGTGMTAALARAIRAEKPIVVTGWQPHWKFAKWKLRFLDDPKNIYGIESVYTVANKNFRTKAPEAAAFLARFSWTDNEVGAVMLAVQEGQTPEQAANHWVTANPERVADWLKQGE